MVIPVQCFAKIDVYVWNFSKRPNTAPFQGFRNSYSILVNLYCNKTRKWSTTGAMHVLRKYRNWPKLWPWDQTDVNVWKLNHRNTAFLSIQTLPCGCVTVWHVHTSPWSSAAWHLGSHHVSTVCLHVQVSTGPGITNLLNIWQLVYFVWGLLLRNAVSYDGEIFHTDAYRPCPKHLLGFISKGVVVTKKWHFSTKIPQCRRTVRSADGPVS